MSYFAKQPVERVVLPSDKEVWVDVYKKFTWKQEKAIGVAVAAGVLHADAVLLNVIADWNLTDESGEVAPVDAEHIDMLAREDAIAIINAVNGVAVVDEDKETKKSSSNASQER